MSRGVAKVTVNLKLSVISGTFSDNVFEVDNVKEGY
jgi:hypothetical protein